MRKALFVILICLFATSCTGTGPRLQPYTGQSFAEWKAQTAYTYGVKLYFMEDNLQIWAIDKCYTCTGRTYYTFINNRLTEVDDGYRFTRSTPNITINVD